MQETISPADHSKRIIIVDSIRGFALAGVLLANFNSYNEQNLPSAVLNAISQPVDKFLMTVNAVFFEWKFMTIFSVLFGYGFGLILTSLANKGIDSTAFFLRRMMWLFLIGLFHTLFWWGDILHIYALGGIVLLFFKKVKNRSLLVWAFILLFIAPGMVEELFQHPVSYFTDEHLQTLYESYRTNDITTIFRANLNFYYHAFIKTGADLHDLIETISRFLLGYYLLRIRIFENIQTKKSLFKKAMLVSAPLAGVYLVVNWLLASGVIHVDGLFREFLDKAGILATSCIYLCCVVTAFIYFGKNRLFTLLAAMGRVTLTNYLLISCFLVLLLYGIGLRKLGELPMHIIWIFGFLWLITEIIFSVLWLRKFRFGPIEWIWRQLSYRQRIRLKK